jgi:sugar (glycoside-pentoside-hexuronide) transporter
MKTDTKGMVVGIDKKIPLVEKLLFSMSTGTATFFIMMVSTWLLYYYTDILKINVAFVGVMFVAIRIADAILTPMFGVYLDRQKTKWGRYKPWFFIVSMGMCIGGFLTFLPVNFGNVGNLVYAVITYFIFSLCLSVNNGPGMGLTTSMSKRQDDRMNISIWGFGWVLVFSMIVQIGSLPLVNMLGNNNQAVGFRNFMLIASIICIIIAIIITFTVKERFTYTPDIQSKFSFKEVVNSLLQNKYAVIAISYIFTINLLTATRSAVGIYYYKYYFNDPNMIVTLGMIMIVPMIIGVLISSPITKKIGLKNNILIMVIVNIVASVLMFFVPATETGKLVFIALYVISNLFVGIAQPAQGVMTPIAVDYGEWKLKTNSGGFFGTLNGFMQTLSTAVAGGVTAMILALVKYVPEVPQTDTALFGIRFMMSILPALMFLIGLVIVKWDMTEAKHKEIVTELNVRREAKANKDAANTVINSNTNTVDL